MTKRHPTQKSADGSDLAERHASVLLATDPKELEAAYDRWAPNYDFDLATLSGGCVNQPGVVAAQVLIRHLPSFRGEEGGRKDLQVLDFGCGTGAAGAYLKEHGMLDTLKQLDGCDLSRGMLDQATKRNCYRRLVKSDFGGCPCESAAYDVVHASGVFAPGQAPPQAFDEFLRVLKPGGHAVFTIRCGYYDSDEGAAHRRYLEDLVERQRWRVVAKTEEEYLPAEDVTAYVFLMKKIETN